MAFVNEVVSDEDIARYNLPFKPGAGRYWTRDKENDFYLWGGIMQSYGLGYEPEGQFELYIKGVLLRVFLDMGESSSSFKDSPYLVVWRQVTHVQPADFGGLGKERVFGVLKKALAVFGYDGRENVFAPIRKVIFEF